MSSPRKRHSPGYKDSPTKMPASPVKKFYSPVKMTPQKLIPAYEKHSKETPVKKMKTLHLAGKKNIKQKEGSINLVCTDVTK